MPGRMEDGIKREIIFNVEAEVKKEFLDSYMGSTKIFCSYILEKADKFEKELGKSMYDFNYEERDELLLVQFKNGSKWAFQSNLSVLKKYVDFCISKNLVRHNENRFAIILPSDYDKYVSVQAVENLYIPKSEIRQLEQKLTNMQDRLIIELIGVYGIRGRNEKKNTHEELINLKISDVDWENKALYITRNNGEFRQVPVDDYTLDLIKSVLSETVYYFNNGYKSTPNEFGEYERNIKGYPINPTDYIFRTPGKTKGLCNEPVDQQLFTNRVQKIQEWLGKPYLTISNIYFSAIIEFAKKLKEQKGELTKEDYIRINDIFQYGEEPMKYWAKIQVLCNNYI
jgi:integrase